MKSGTELQQRILTVLDTESEEFAELVKVAGLDPAEAFVGASLKGVDFGEADLTGFDFSGADLSGCDFSKSVYEGAIFDGARVDFATRFGLLGKPDVVILIGDAEAELRSHPILIRTPKGDLIELDHGSTPVDFACVIHSQLGLSIRAAKIDGIRVPLWTELESGMSVEIVNDLEGKIDPTRLEAAYSFVKSKRARQIIGRALRRMEKERGRQKFEAEILELYPNLGGKRRKYGKIKEMVSGQMDELIDFAISRRIEPICVASALPIALMLSETDSGCLIGLDENTKHRVCLQCLPEPGRRIVGISHHGRIVEAHDLACSLLETYEAKPHRWIEMGWPTGSRSLQLTDVDIRPSTLQRALMLAKGWL